MTKKILLIPFTLALILIIVYLASQILFSRIPGYEYGQNSNMIRTIEPLGKTTIAGYDALNRPTAIITEAGKTTVEYDSVGNIIKSTDHLGHSKVMEYDLKGNMTKSTDPMGNSTLFEYDPSGNLIKTIDPIGNTVTQEFDAMNRITAITNPLGGKTSIKYDKNGNIISTTDSEGSTTTYAYDKNDRVTTITSPCGGKTQVEYDKNGNRTAITNPLGYTKKTSYDALNRESTLTDEAGYKTIIIRDPMGKVLSATNPEGATTLYEYTPAGKISKVTDAAGNTTTFAYDALNRMISTTNQRGHTTQYKYNSMDLVVAITSPTGETTTYEYDANGNQIKETNPENQTTTQEYNPLNQLVKATDALGHATHFTYTAVGRIASATDKNGNTTKYNYDGAGNIIETIDANGHSSYFEYDTLSRLVKMKLYRAESDTEQITLYQYNSQGLVTKVINPQGDSKISIYDANGNLTQATDEDGYITTYEYDPRNLVKSVNYSDDRQIYFAYNKTGELVQVQDWLGTTSFELDNLNRIISTNDHSNNKVTYTYDASGNQTEINYSDNTKAKYEYDPLNRLTAVTDTAEQITKYNYSPAGYLLQVLRANGITEDRKYDSLGRLTEVYETANQRNTPTLINSYAYDPQGNPTREYKKDLLGGSNQDIHYTYDRLNRLIAATDSVSSLSRSYNYDSLGNIIREIEMLSGSQTITSYSINQANRLIGKTIGQQQYSYAYDKRGNLIEELDIANNTGAIYNYDASNKMIAGKNSAGQESIYSYNGLGALVSNSGEYNKNYVLDYTTAVPKKLMETQADILQKYIYAKSNIASAIIDGGVSGKTSLHYHTDKLGSVTHITGADGTIQALANYDEWGNITKSKPLAIEGKTLDLANSYTGHDFDSLLCKYYAKARMYDPANKRFAAEDMIKGYAQMPTTLTAYTYCVNNPLQYVDANGMWHDMPEGDGGDAGNPAEMPPPERIAYNTNPDYLFRPPIGYWTDNYRGVPVVVVPNWVPGFGNYSGMSLLNRLYIGPNVGASDEERYVAWASSMVRHEWGHYVQLQMLGGRVYWDGIASPSVHNSRFGAPYTTAIGNSFGYELQLWEVTADILGGVPRNAWFDRYNPRRPVTRNIQAEVAGLRYLFMLIEISELNYNDQTRALFGVNRASEAHLLQLITYDFPCPGTGSINEAASRNRP